jgi:hypothetical protein
MPRVAKALAGDEALPGIDSLNRARHRRERAVKARSEQRLYSAWHRKDGLPLRPILNDT